MRAIYLCAGVLFIILLVIIGIDRSSDRLDGWRIEGRNLDNCRSQPGERQIDAENVHRLVAKWEFPTWGSVSATPTVADNTVYFPDWAGNLYAVRASNGELLWSRRISEYNGVARSLSQLSPAIYGDLLIIGDRWRIGGPPAGANVIAVDRNSGALRWITKVESNPSAVIIGSPVFHETTVYVGVSSLEKTLARNPEYPCCSFRGSIVALDAQTGQLRWKTYTTPDNGAFPNRYSGNAVWSPPAIDPLRGSLYVATGSNYTVPENVLRCRQNALEGGYPDRSCIAPDDYFNSVLSLDLTTGAVKWARRLTGMDKRTATFASLTFSAEDSAQPLQTSEFDFSGSGPNLLRLRDGDLIGIGQKTGIYWALDPSDGRVVWKTAVGPGHPDGGIRWGTACDGTRIYISVNNPSHERYSLAYGGRKIDNGSWAALDPSTGRILWQVPDPAVGADPGAVSVANGVVYSGSRSGAMYALDARDGSVRFAFAAGGSIFDAPSIVDGTVYWGSGYRNGGNKLYAFSILSGW
ncbi:MAG: PQQ-binding-like beta-propeller repeat protein [Blastocatellia bacterium]|nr:PQQ-binding-like beta-propeller repeat protein [Blastocatellia bacterium]